MADRGVDGPLVERPFVSLSLERWEAAGVRDEDLWKAGEDVEEEPRRTCEDELLRLRQGIFSRLTTGSDTHVLFRAPLGGYTASGALLKRE